MGLILAREYAWPDAERHFRRAIDLDRNNAIAHLGLGVDVLLMQGRADDALDVDQLRIAINLDPGRARPYGLLARALFAQGRTADAMTVFDEAIRRGALLPGLSNGDLACVATRAGRRNDQVVAMLQREFSSRMANTAARAYACIGDATEALHHLEKAVAAREPNLAELLQDPYVAWMHADDRFATFRRQLKLPDRSTPLSAH